MKTNTFAAARVWHLDGYYMASAHDENATFMCVSKHETLATADRAARLYALRYEVDYDGTVRVCGKRVSDTDVAYNLPYALEETA